jgi:hypothetical protein
MSVLITFDGSFLGLAYEGGMGSLADSGYWSSSDLQVPLAASLGPHTITATDALGFTASATFTVTAPLTAISVNPSSGPADSLIRISGHDFSKSIDEESVTITFDGSLLGFAYEGGTGSLANSGSWSSGDLYVPKTATVGTHTITATDAVGFTATATFTVTEPLTAISVSPSSGPIGSLISVSGHDFAKSIDEETVIINLDGLRLGLAYEGGTGSLANSGSWSSANLQVPLTASVGIHTITATDWAGFTATTTFTVTAPTSKITLTPSSGLANSQFKVSGTDFYQSINEISLTIKFDGKFLAFAYEGGVGLNNLGTWTSLNLNIPSDASIGPHTVTATDEAGFTATATFTVTAPTISTTIVTTLDHSATVDQLRQTGIQVQITGATLTDGTSITVSTANFDTAQPAGTGTPFGQRPTFYDTQVTLTDGQPIGGDVMVLVTIQSSGITSGDLIYYWNGANWIPAAGQSHDEAGSVSGMIPASALTGTPIMVTDQTIMVTPEYPLGALIAIAACFAAFITFKKRSSLHKSHPN